MDLFEELVDTPSKSRFWVVLVTVSLFTYTVAIAGMYGSEGWSALLARFAKAKGWFSSPTEEQEKKAPPPDTGTQRATHSLHAFDWSYPSSERSAPTNANDATGPDNLAENPPAPEIPAKTGNIWDRLPPINLTRRRTKRPGDDEEAARPGAGSEATGAPGEKKTKPAWPEEVREWAEVRKNLGRST